MYTRAMLQNPEERRKCCLGWCDSSWSIDASIDHDPTLSWRFSRRGSSTCCDTAPSLQPWYTATCLCLFFFPECVAKDSRLTSSPKKTCLDTCFRDWFCSSAFRTLTSPKYVHLRLVSVSVSSSSSSSSPSHAGCRGVWCGRCGIRYNMFMGHHKPSQACVNTPTNNQYSFGHGIFTGGMRYPHHSRMH